MNEILLIFLGGCTGFFFNLVKEYLTRRFIMFGNVSINVRPYFKYDDQDNLFFDITLISPSLSVVNPFETELKKKIFFGLYKKAILSFHTTGSLEGLIKRHFIVNIDDDYKFQIQTPYASTKKKKYRLTVFYDSKMFSTIIITIIPVIKGKSKTANHKIKRPRFFL